jgi:Flp pilus assembly protein TadD
MTTIRMVEDRADSVAVFNLAMEHMHRCHFGQAARALREALQQSPGNPEYLSFLGLCLAREGSEYDAAVKLCRRALNQKPYDTLLQVNLGRVYRLMGKNAQAHRIFQRAREWDSANRQAAVELARMGVRRQPALPFLPRSHWCNRYLGLLRSRVFRSVESDRRAAA